MKRILILVLFFLAQYGISQPIINSGVFPVIGDTIIRQFAKSLGIVQGNSGANITWDFSTLISDTPSYRIYVNPSQTPFVANYPNATVCRKDWTGIFYSYWKPLSTKAEYYGFTEIGNVDTKFTDPADYYRFPASYGMTYVDSLYAYTAGGTLQSPGKHYFHADAWGKLILPNRTYNSTLRIRTDTYVGDSIFGSYSLNTEYTWFANGTKDFVLVIGIININGNISRYVLYDKSKPVGIEEFGNIEKLDIYPNPVSEYLNINLSKSSFSTNDKIEIIDITGKMINDYSLSSISRFNQRNSIDVSSLNNGLYFLRLITDDKVFVGKFIKK